MTITALFSDLFYGGAGVSELVPNPYDIALNGRPYILDDKHEAFKQGVQTIPFLREQADTSTEPGEASVNREDLWARPVTSWHKGAGQKFLDRGESDRARFWRSYGVDPWTEGRLSLLPGTSLFRASASTNVRLAVAGDYLYVSDGTQVYHYANHGSFASPVSADIQAGEAAQTVRSITSNGHTVWAALGSNGIHSTTRGATSSTHYSALSCTLLRYVKDRLMAANGQSIYNVVASGAAPSALFTHPSTDWTWVDFAAGLSHIYAAGYAGDKSTIYKIPIKDDGTGLDAPLVAGQLPDGEIVYSICGYLGFVVIGTEKGFRLATEADDGSLTIGALVDHVERPVRCFEPQGRFVFFGWENFDNTYTGLGRMDLSVFTAPNVPAYATDIQRQILGDVVSAATWQDAQVYVIDGQGVVLGNASSDRAWVESGLIDYGLPGMKVALEIPLSHEELESGAYINVYMKKDHDADYTYIGTSDEDATIAPPEPIAVGQMAGRQFQVFMQIYQTVLERWELRAYPSASRGKELVVPILLHEDITLPNGSTIHCDPAAELEALESFVGADRLTSYQELGSRFSMFLTEVHFERHSPTKSRHWWNGTAVCRLKILGG